MNAMAMNWGNWEANAVGYSTVETLLEDVSKQMALSNLTRFARNSNTQHTQRPSGGSMRVVKPNSASNSPRGSIGLGRRRTVMADNSLYRRRAPVADQQSVQSMSSGFASNDGLEVPTRSNRPVSWHPSSQHISQPPCQPYYQAPTYDFNNPQFNYLSSSSAVYSGYPSPSLPSASIPPYTGFEQQQYFPDNTIPCQPDHYLASQPAYMMESQQDYSPPQLANLDSTMYPEYEWNTYASNSFENTTTPPTPENFLPIQHPEPSFPSEESIPYQSLDDDESDGEHLVGLGLYDTPEAAKSPSPDPQLDNYRSLMMNQLLGTTYRRPEPIGKGLKLEEGWAPPSDDEQADGGEEADGDCEDEESAEEEVAPGQHMPQGNWV